MQNNRIDSIRNALRNNIGQPVKLHVIGDRNKVIDACGILDGVYSDIFTILVNNNDYYKRYCYTYSEIITKNVAITLVNAQ